MIRSVIVENERKHSKHLVDLIQKHFPEIEVLTICETVPDAVAQVKELKPELVFLDVELQPYTGFDFLEQTPGHDYKVIFATSHEHYAARAFSFCALHYLIKPFGFPELKDAIDRFKRSSPASIQNKQIESLKKNLKQTEINNLEIYVPVKNGLHKLSLGEIICCSTGAIAGGSIFRLVDKDDVIISKSLNWIEEQLNNYHFFRTHDSYFVNLHHVVKITHVREGAEIILSDGKPAEVSKRRKAGLLKAIEDLNIIRGKI